MKDQELLQFGQRGKAFTKTFPKLKRTLHTFSSRKYVVEINLCAIARK